MTISKVDTAPRLKLLKPESNDSCLDTDDVKNSDTSGNEVNYQLFENDIEFPNNYNNDNQQLNLIGNGNFQKSLSANTNMEPKEYKWQIVWRNVIAIGALHVLALFSLVWISPFIQWKTFWFSIVLMNMMSLGVQVGAHRLWSHRAFKANFGLRLFLAFCNTLALQNDIYEWCRDHRGHHKFAETDADPHNAKRGFFFSHVGWLLVRKHPEVLRRGKTVDLSDLEADPVVAFQRKYYIPLVLFIWGFLPTYIPVYFWSEDLFYSFMACVVFRYVYILNITWSVNSWAHMFGSQPYDSRTEAVECSIRHLLNGEGFHNYHHAFPWDYSASELGSIDVFNPATGFIDFCHYMGWAYDLKRANPSTISRMIDSKGDGSWHYGNVRGVTEWIVGLICSYVPLTLYKFVTMYYRTT